jgi:hypothetical protein
MHYMKIHDRFKVFLYFCENALEKKIMVFSTMVKSKLKNCLVNFLFVIKHKSFLNKTRAQIVTSIDYIYL